MTAHPWSFGIFAIFVLLVTLVAAIMVSIVSLVASSWAPGVWAFAILVGFVYGIVGGAVISAAVLLLLIAIRPGPTALLFFGVSVIPWVAVAVAVDLFALESPHALPDILVAGVTGLIGAATATSLITLARRRAIRNRAHPDRDGSSPYPIPH